MEVKEFGNILKSARINAGKSVKEASDLLQSKGFKASNNTIYNWENGYSQPTPDSFLTLCDFYNVSDILYFFGYRINPIEIDSIYNGIIKKYRSLNENGQRDFDNHLEVLLKVPEYRASSLDTS